MVKIFSESNELKSFIEKHGWTLYDVSDSMKGIKPEFSNLEKQGPAKEFVFGGHYLFTPIPESGQSLIDAYSVTKGLGPLLLIDDREHERWRSLCVEPKQNILYVGGRGPSTGYVALFSRLSFDDRTGNNGEENAYVWTPTSAYLNPDFVAIRAHLTLDTFQKYFRIVQAHPNLN